MIDPRREDQAALHVLGALDEREAREFQSVLRQDPELQAYVARLSKVTGVIAGSVAHTAPPPRLREQILREIGGRPAPQAAPERPSSRPQGFGFWLPWALAGGMAVVGGLVAGRYYLQSHNLQETVARQTVQITELTQLAASLQTATNNLAQTVQALQETNRLANVRIAMLNSQIASLPTAVGVTLWDDRKQEGVFVAENLQTLPPGRDYQLWVIDPQYGTPVSAGVFQVNAQGVGRIDFKPLKNIATATKFAVTQEPKGGQATPSLNHLMLMGG